MTRDLINTLINIYSPFFYCWPGAQWPGNILHTCSLSIHNTEGYGLILHHLGR